MEWSPTTTRSSDEDKDEEEEEEEEEEEVEVEVDVEVEEVEVAVEVEEVKEVEVEDDEGHLFNNSCNAFLGKCPRGICVFRGGRGVSEVSRGTMISTFNTEPGCAETKSLQSPTVNFNLKFPTVNSGYKNNRRGLAQNESLISLARSWFKT